nr:YcjF family protein [Enterococcus mundtii]
MKRLPQKTSAAILRNFDSSKSKAEQTLAKSKTQFDRLFEEFLKGVDEPLRRKCHATIHAASLTAAIIGCSPIPFSDAFLLVPVQLTMMGRLHKLFGQSWSESLGKSVSKELIVVSLGRSAVGNIIKIIPAVGTVAGAAINATVASTITESLGWITVKMLNDGEDIFDDVMSFKGQVQTLFTLLKRKKQMK